MFHSMKLHVTHQVAVAVNWVVGCQSESFNFHLYYDGVRKLRTPHNATSLTDPFRERCDTSVLDLDRMTMLLC